MDTSYEGTLREVSTDKGVLRYHEVAPAPTCCSCTARALG